MTSTRETIGTYRQLWECPPDEQSEDASIWYHRAQNSVVVYLSGPQGATFARHEQPDEYFVWALTDAVKVSADGASESGRGVFIVPPGSSTVELLDEGSVWMGFTSQAQDLVHKSPNRLEYEPPQENISPLYSLNEPEGGYALRRYDVDADPPGHRCYVHRTAMTRFRWPFRTQPRDRTAMSPHDHEDFEQSSLIVQGTVIHHMRRHWGHDSRAWMPDEHEPLVAPAIAISKPPDIHTTQAVTRMTSVGLIDFFAPARWDLLTTPGMVTNADIYGIPDRAPSSHEVADFLYPEGDPRRALETSGPASD